MPKELEKKLKKQVAGKNWSQERKNAYIYGTLRKTGWKPSHQKEEGIDRLKEIIKKMIKEEMDRDEEVNDEITEDDITTEDHNHWYQYGKLYHVGDEKSLKDKMDEDQFWPNVFFISDHGNIIPIIFRDEETDVENIQDKNPMRGSWGKGEY